MSRPIRSLPPGHSVVTIRWSPRPAAKASYGSSSLPEYTPRLDSVPPGRSERRALSNVCCVPRASMATSAPAAGQPLDLGDDVDLGEVERHVGAHPLRHRESDRVAVDADDLGGAHQPGAGRGAQADRALGEHDDRVADPHAARLGAGEAGRGDVGEQDDLLVGHAVRDLREVGLRLRHEQVLGLRAVDRVAEAPAADRLVARRRGRTGDRWPERQAWHWPHGVIAPTRTRSPIS